METNSRKDFTYYLPGKDGLSQKPIDEIHHASSHVLFIVGANGTGKSHLGAWMESKNMNGVHRIGGQRNLNFDEYLYVSEEKASEMELFYGRHHDSEYSRNGKWDRWDHGKKMTTALLNDFNAALSCLLAKTIDHNARYVKLSKEAEEQKKEKPKTSQSEFDKLTSIWKSIFPQRTIDFKGTKFLATAHDLPNSYSATQMSDGERAVLYIIAQILSVRSNVTIIIDEPEIHLHRSIMSKLWQMLEQARPDCLFIYITHDIQFAAQHPSAELIWVKSYNGVSWEWEKIQRSDIPDELLLEILGSRKNVLFVEGERGHFDTQLYERLYPNFHVIPCGGCKQVIARTKAFRQLEILHNCNVVGIIDLDYRSPEEIELLMKDGIYVLGVAEVENLFLVEELLTYYANHKKYEKQTVFSTLSNIKDDIINKYFHNDLEEQVLQSVTAQVKYKFSRIATVPSDKTIAFNALKQSITNIYNNFDNLYTIERDKYSKAYTERNYGTILTIYNKKKLLPCIIKYFHESPQEYHRIILNGLNDEDREKIVTALTPYLPKQIEIRPKLTGNSDFLTN